MKYLEESIEIDGNKLTLQFGKLAQNATTSVFARMNDTCILVTVTLGKENNDIDYFPLSVEYVEKLYAGGVIKGSRWVKREGKPTDEAILKGRIIDRSIRPFFPKTYRREVQVVATLMSVDNTVAPEVLATIASAVGVHLSPAPWNGPVAATQIGLIKDSEGNSSFIINPTQEEELHSDLDLFVTSNREKVVMIETAAKELSNDVIKEGIQLAKKENMKLIEFMDTLREKVGMPKEQAAESLIDPKLKETLKHDFDKEIDKLVAYKADREFDDGSMMKDLVGKVVEKTGEEFTDKQIAEAFDYLAKDKIRSKTINEKVRIDGRGIDDIRPLSAEVGILPRTHGTGLFKRGATQVLSVLTLGAPGLEQLIDGPEGQEEKRYMHHYNFPPYSVGETGRIGFTNRREIGHGALAEKALLPVLPTEEEFPYVIRIVSEVLTSNGSTSMASTCGSSMSLMDAGVPIKRPVAGIAMGLMSESDDKYVILTDIMGIEDFSGEMDFKVTGTTEGVTAIQLDVKNMGLTDAMIDEILDRAQSARLRILEVMNGAISEPRKEISQYAPKIETLQLPEDMIGTVIGPGGKTIKSIIALTDTDINIEDDGSVTVAGIDQVKVAKALEMINNLIRQVEVGEEFDGEVKRLMAFGAFVEVLPGKEGLVHVSKMSNGFVKNPEDVVQVGDKVKVKVHEIDSQGRINLVMTQLPDGTPVEIDMSAAPDRHDQRRMDRRGGGGGRRYDDRRGGDRRDHRGPRRDDRRRY
ncbi:polyribonucleotide nucleotidyltransferase [Candidatus Roizmanbacteria bacterium]|nr:MAG: polyribonucleotide nucleotidyltransferase [Candidatus Roizmanbacteria bacterium]